MGEEMRPGEEATDFIAEPTGRSEAEGSVVGSDKGDKVPITSREDLLKLHNREVMETDYEDPQDRVDRINDDSKDPGYLARAGSIASKIADFEQRASGVSKAGLYEQSLKDLRNCRQQLIDIPANYDRNDPRDRIRAIAEAREYTKTAEKLMEMLGKKFKLS